MGRRQLIDRLLAVERSLSERGVIESYGGKDYFGSCTDDKITIQIEHGGGGIFYYQIAFHEIIHYLERNLWEEIKDTRQEALEKLRKELYDYRYDHELLTKAFRKESGKMLIDLYKLITGEDYEPPPYSRSYPEFFPSLVEMIYLKWEWEFLKKLLSPGGKRELFGYLDYLIDTGTRKLGIGNDIHKGRRKRTPRFSR